MNPSPSNKSRKILRSAAAFALATVLVQTAFAQEAVIRKNIAERLPDFPKIDEVTKTAIPGLYELRLGTDVIYTDERGDYIIEGQLVDTKSRTNLTEARIDKLTAIDFAALPLKDAVVWKQGTGARKLVVFADPNCGYCKQFEKNMQQVKDVTVYTFLYPILGGDSPEKSRNIWCAKNNGTVWRDWMINGTPPVKTMGECDTSAIERNVAMGKKFRVNGTPNLVFENGKRVPGALPPDQVEKNFSSPPLASR
jgi:thiol:disulfide interchange protein DsbC